MNGCTRCEDILAYSEWYEPLASKSVILSYRDCDVALSNAG